MTCRASRQAEKAPWPKRGAVNSLAHLRRGLGVVAVLRPGVAKAQLQSAPSYGSCQLAPTYRAPQPRRNTNTTTMSTKRSRQRWHQSNLATPSWLHQRKKNSQHVWVAKEDLHRGRPRWRRPAAGHAPRQNHIRHQLQVPAGNELGRRGHRQGGWLECSSMRWAATVGRHARLPAHSFLLGCLRTWHLPTKPRPHP